MIYFKHTHKERVIFIAIDIFLLGALYDFDKLAGTESLIRLLLNVLCINDFQDISTRFNGYDDMNMCHIYIQI